MIKKITKLLLISILFKFTFLTASQNSTLVPDTILFNGKKTLIYPDNTWKPIADFAENEENEEIGNEAIEGHDNDADSMFSSNWVTQQVFSYRNKNNIIKESVKLALIDPLRAFFFPKYGRVLRGFARKHKGLDIKLNTGDPVFAAFDGKVRFASYNRRGFGNLVVIRHYNGLETYYAHLSKINVKVNDMLTAGDDIGLGGSTGRSTTPHLHFEIRYQDQPIDPQKIVDYENNSLISDVIDLDKSFFTPLLKMASQGSKSISKSNNNYYIVKKGDTLSRIAKKNKKSVKEICSLNNISKKTVLKPGRKLVVD